ncbi:hypothetical protein D9611_008008 [Ephemerocybe angulata]|uniref:Uncharacterized protein n=1 Tax=Ephemerocybe angulata TaxID=980116 RepID=A0A8H5BYY2_9AGAR|nr:hypothetical protein D9611_008008 [Tulosesus angulatus]
MRVSRLAILPIALALASTVTAYYDARADYINDLATRDYGLEDDVLGTRNLLIDMSTRDIVEELKRRGVEKPRFICFCGAAFAFSDRAEAEAHCKNLGQGHKVLPEIIRCNCGRGFSNEVEPEFHMTETAKQPGHRLRRLRL